MDFTIPRNIQIERIEKFLSTKYFADVNIRSKIYDKCVPFESLEVFSLPLNTDGEYKLLEGRKDFSALPFSQLKSVFADGKLCTNASVGDSFGPTWSTHWFKAVINIPLEWEGKEVHLRWNNNAETQLFSEHGTLLQGLTGKDGAERHEYVIKEGQKVFYLEMSCNGLFGAGDGDIINPPDPSIKYTLERADIAIFNGNAWNLLWDIDVLYGIAKNQHESSSFAVAALVCATTAINAFKSSVHGNIDSALAITEQFFMNNQGSHAESRHRVTAVGNCHIDTAWLWTYSETVRKCGRSWSTALEYMSRYDSYIFAASQAQQFEWVSLRYPELFKKIKEYVKKGQFLPVGGTWVEMDCNIPNGESLVRQFLLGQSYFEHEFGKTCNEFWLPDTFGYSAQLPQIVTLADIDYFLTQKLCWNNFNVFPHHSFVWEGIDGSCVTAHFPPTNTYCGSLSVEEVLAHEKRYLDKDRANFSLLLYGVGDGGGGPKLEHLERLERMRDIDGMPKVDSMSVKNFFDQFKSNELKSPLCRWVGELYLELHRGTYTSQGQTKKLNRRCEILLRSCEVWCTIAHSLCEGYEYPRDKLDKMWKLLCLNQFHDVIPGSSIGEVYKDAVKFYNEVICIGVAVYSDACAHILGLSSKPCIGGIFNSHGIARREILPVSGGNLAICEVGPMSFLPIYTDAFPFHSNSLQPAECKAPSVCISNEQLSESEYVSILDLNGEICMENSFVRIKIDKLTGHIVSYLFKECDREIISQPTKKYTVYDDVPLFWDAWDIESYHLQVFRTVDRVENIRIVENGPLRVAVKITYKISEESSLNETLYLSVLTPTLDCQCLCDWHENRKCLKVLWPVDVRSAQATYEIQYGQVQRSTHSNTSWDAAAFEVCAQRWCDLSEHGFGVSLLNDCKYGHSVHHSTISLTLLRSPKAPDSNCDMGEHSFKFGLYPHKGTVHDVCVVQAAAAYNDPLELSRCDSITSTPKETGWPFIQCDSDSVIIEAVKMAECGDGIIVRLYEAYGGTVRTSLKFGHKIQKISICNLLEKQPSMLKKRFDKNMLSISDVARRSVTLTVHPFEILTLHLVLDC